MRIDKPFFFLFFDSYRDFASRAIGNSNGRILGPCRRTERGRSVPNACYCFCLGSVTASTSVAAEHSPSTAYFVYNSYVGWPITYNLDEFHMG